VVTREAWSSCGSSGNIRQHCADKGGKVKLWLAGWLQRGQGEVTAGWLQRGQGEFTAGWLRHNQFRDVRQTTARGRSQPSVPKTADLCQDMWVSDAMTPTNASIQGDGKLDANHCGNSER